MARAYTSRQRREDKRRHSPNAQRAAALIRPAPWWLMEAVRRDLDQRKEQQ